MDSSIDSGEERYDYKMDESNQSLVEMNEQLDDVASAETFTTLSVHDVMEGLRSDIESASEILGLSPETTLLVFRRYGWRMDDNTLERYMNSRESIDEELQIKDNVACADGGAVDLSRPVLVWSSSEAECPVCGDVVGAGGCVALARCRHFLCFECFKANLEYTVRHCHDFVSKRCPIRGCSSLVGLSVFEQLLPHHLYEQVQHRLLNEYVSSHKHMRCCPSGISCEGIVRVSVLRESGPDVYCLKCGLQFCFKCLQPPHAPATCDMLKRWADLARENEPSLAVIQKTTRGCPGCSIRIEKDSGCNHMICTQCRYEYCWVCLGPWSEHNNQYYKCDKKIKSDQGSEKDLFLDCYASWSNHKCSRLLETRSLQGILLQLRKLAQQQRETASFDKVLTTFLDTQKLLFECRSVLMNGYVALFFTEQVGSTFHYRLHQLELCTEETSRLIDTSPELLDADKIRCRAAQASHWCQTLRGDTFY
ncbi:IBR domain [Trypanosoma vivax]|uniref:RBR-type E3 ubiquitin transferase n=1 Tax=Trypanosoma vivax (strain Y486) TaxID=1055687 RepID=G0TX45_TRYVY|nr:hypothetical protein TRVL_07086 [Trypanosoma vivax]KAH8613652.1 IBR domain [Trypanosoma vivax]CCC48535.1 putative conserved RING finger protein [Trypanosoma vivax Y486]